MNRHFPDAEPITGWRVFVRRLAYERAVQWLSLIHI